MDKVIEKSQHGAINVPSIWSDDRLSLIEKAVMWNMITTENEVRAHRKEFYCIRNVVASKLGIKPSTFTNSIKKLATLGYLQYRTEGRRNYYTIQWDYINSLDTEKEPLKEPQSERMTNYIQEVKAPQIKPGNCEIEPVLKRERKRYQTSWNVPVQVQPQRVEVRSKEDEKPAQIPQSLYDMIMKKIPQHIYNVSFKDLEKEEVQNMISKMIGKTGNMSFDTWKKNENMVSTPLWVSQLWTII